MFRSNVWPIGLNVFSDHGNPYHQPTSGKLESFHRSLKAKVRRGRTLDSPPQAQEAMQRRSEIRDCGYAKAGKAPRTAFRRTPLDRWQKSVPGVDTSTHSCEVFGVLGFSKSTPQQEQPLSIYLTGTRPSYTPRAKSPNASTTSLGACTSSINTPSPAIGNSSLALGCRKVMS